MAFPSKKGRAKIAAKAKQKKLQMSMAHGAALKEASGGTAKKKAAKLANSSFGSNALATAGKQAQEMFGTLDFGKMGKKEKMAHRGNKGGRVNRPKK